MSVTYIDAIREAQDRPPLSPFPVPPMTPPAKSKFLSEEILSSDGVPLGALCIVDSAARIVTPKDTTTLDRAVKIVSFLVEKNLV